MIAKRRAKVDDPNRERLPDSPDSDPWEVLGYLQKHSGPGIPRWVLQADVCDAITLLNWLWWQLQRTELHFLLAGKNRGLFLAQLGAQLGIGKQGTLDRMDRLTALLQYDRPDEKLTREARRTEREKRSRAATEDAWLSAHREELVAVITDLVRQADRYIIDDDDRQWIDELAIDARDDNFTPATMAILGLGTAEMRNAPSVLGLDSTRPHGVHATLARADRLRSQFAELGAKAKPENSPAVRTVPEGG